MKSNRTKDLLIRIAKAAAVPLIAWAIMQVIDMAFAGMGVINNAADVKTLFRNLISSLAFALAIGANLNCGRMDLSLGAQMYAGVIFGADTSYSALEQSSLVVSRYRIGNAQTGYVGLIGPLRMDYELLLPSIKYFADKLNDSFPKDTVKG